MPTRLMAQTPPPSLPTSNVAPGAATPLASQDDRMPDIGIDWPDMNAPLPPPELPPPEPESDGVSQASVGEPAPPALINPADVQSASDESQGDEPLAGEPISDDGSERRYGIEMIGIDDVADATFRSRFNELSLLQEGKGKRANLAQINRRMKQDRQVLDRLLRAKGYYDASIRQSITAPPGDDKGKVTVRFEVIPGQLYTLSQVVLPGLDAAVPQAPKIRDAFPVYIGDPVNADKIFDGKAQLATTLGESGFPFARVDEPVVEIDHAVRQGELSLPVVPGGYRTFGDIVITRTGKRPIFSARHLGRIARFRRDDVYMASDVEDLRRAIVTTGLVSSVTLKPVDAGDGEHVNLDVALAPAPMRTISGEAGFGTGEGYRVGASWQHRNFFPPEGAITVRGLVGTREQLVGLTYRRNNYKRRDQVLTGALVIQHQQLDAYSAKTASISGSLERQTNLIFQKKWAWNFGFELAASQERDVFGARAARSNRTYFIGALPTGLTYDGTDDLLDPKSGFRLGGRLSPEISLQGTTFGYARAQVDGSAYLPMGERVVVAGRVRAGSIFGSHVDRIAPSRRFYAGGGASVRGYGYQALGPRDANNNPVGGKSLIEFSLETRVRFGNFGLVPFVDAGNISTRFLPRFNAMRFGAGMGGRYYSSFGPIRIDVGTPINRRPGDGRVTVYVSLGQAF